jgi:hypothetical protein
MLSDGLISDYSKLLLLVLLDPQSAKFRCRIPNWRPYIIDVGGRSGQHPFERPDKCLGNVARLGRVLSTARAVIRPVWAEGRASTGMLA